MSCDVLGIGTELLLGQIVDTNSSWIGEHLAMVGIDTMEHRKVGDNLPRMIAALSRCSSRPTPSRVWRARSHPGRRHPEAIAAVMGVELERREELVAHIEQLFGSACATCRRTTCARPTCRSVPTRSRTRSAPRRLRAEVDGKVVYAVPGVPYEMQLMITEQVLPDLLARAGESAVIVSRSLKTWGKSESGLAEMIADRVDAQTNPTIAFLARDRGPRRTADREGGPDERRGADRGGGDGAARDPRRAGVRHRRRDIEHAALHAFEARGWTLGVAESLTAGLIGARIGAVPGASRTFRGSIASYATEVKQSVLGVTTDHVVSEQYAIEMAVGAQRVLGADVGIAATGVAGPDEQDGQPPGTVWFASRSRDGPEAFTTRLPGDREHVRQFSAISLLNALRQRLESLARDAALRRAFLAAVPPPRCSMRSASSWAAKPARVPLDPARAVARDDPVLRSGRRPRRPDRRARGAARRVPAAPVQLRGAGAFPNERRASVYWLGVADPEPLVAVHAAVIRGGRVRAAA